MFYRCMVAISLLLFLSTQAPAAGLFPLPDGELDTAALKYRQRSYKEAREAALKAPQGGVREFLLGLSAARLEEWGEAADHLSKAADSFPLLADYALYNEARALFMLARFNEALSPLQRVIKDFPDSPLSRSTRLLHADTLFEAKDFKSAYDVYQKFIEKFPSGTDSLSATYKSALCLEQLDDTAGAVASLRSIWLRYPASTFAAKADDDLQRLAAKGIKVEPYSAEELLRRVTTLFDLKKFDMAAKALKSIPLDTQPEAAIGSRLLKTGQALYKSRKYKDAEATLSALLARKPGQEIADDASYWLAKALDRNGRDEEAFTAFIKLAESSAGSDLAGKALFEAALIKKEEKKLSEALPILKRILLMHPASPLKQSVTWEIAWGSYQAGDMKTAAEYLKALTERDPVREKALYWYGRALIAAGDVTGAQGAFSALLTEYPYGFYTQSYKKELKLAGDDISFPAGNLLDILPVPAGYERVKALITLGLHDEARNELSFSRKKGGAKQGALAGLARLYLEMEDYNGAYNLLRKDRPRKFEKETIYQWGISFPLVYREHVAKLASDHDIPESLIYSIIRAESSFLPTAISPAGAVGLMQLMPTTAAAMSNGNKRKIDTGTLTRPETNIRFGVRHLRDLLDLYRGDLILAVAAYNAGSGNVNRWIKSFGTMRKDEFVENIPFGETREYVKKVLANSEIYSRLYKLDKPNTFATSPSPPLKPGAAEPAGTQSSLSGGDTAATGVSPPLPAEPDLRTQLPVSRQL